MVLYLRLISLFLKLETWCSPVPLKAGKLAKGIQSFYIRSSPSFEFPVSAIREQAVIIILNANFPLPSIANCKVFYFIKYISHTHPLGTIILTLVTAKATPEHVWVEYGITETEIGCANDLMRQHIKLFHGVFKIPHHRTARGAGRTRKAIIWCGAR